MERLREEFSRAQDVYAEVIMCGDLTIAPENVVAMIACNTNCDQAACDIYSAAIAVEKAALNSFSKAWSDYNADMNAATWNILEAARKDVDVARKDVDNVRNVLQTDRVFRDR